MITLRPATINDATRLYVWRNHPSTRVMMQNMKPFPWEHHMSFLRWALSVPDVCWYIAEADEQPVGSVRFDLEPMVNAVGQQAHVSVTVAPECRGAGYGTELLSIGTARMLDGEVKRVLACIKLDNVASQKAFAKAGYVERSRTETEVVFVAERMGA